MGSRGTPNGGKPSLRSLLGKKLEPLFRRIDNFYEAIAVVNPNYQDNWRYIRPKEQGEGSEFWKYGRNCALCSAAGALQLLGYDVEAMPRDTEWRGSNTIFDVKFDAEHAIVPADKGYYSDYNVPGEKPAGERGMQNWSDAYDNPNRASTDKTVLTKQISDFMSNAGVGAIADFGVWWKSGGGHSVILYQQRTRTIVIDFQTHQTYNLEDYMREHSIIPEKTQVTRLDNVAIRKDTTNFDKVFKRRNK